MADMVRHRRPVTADVGSTGRSSITARRAAEQAIREHKIVEAQS
jgi:hypothetical protein